MEQVSRSQAQVEGQDQVRQIAVIYKGDLNNERLNNRNICITNFYLSGIQMYGIQMVVWILGHHLDTDSVFKWGSEYRTKFRGGGVKFIILA